MNRILQNVTACNSKNYYTNLVRKLSHHCTKQRMLSIVHMNKMGNNLDTIFKTNDNIIICDSQISKNQHPIKGYKWDEGNVFSSRKYSWHLKNNNNVLEKWPLLIGETVSCDDYYDDFDLVKIESKPFDSKYDVIITSIRFNENKYLESEKTQFFDTMERVDEKKHRIVVVTDNEKMFDELINTTIREGKNDELVKKIKYVFKTMIF